jgi:glycosyltransferase involved in cell wall biosynthesis
MQARKVSPKESALDTRAGFRAVDFKREVISDFISVIIPVFRDASGLEDTLSSLTEQTIPSSHYEIIVSNDGAGQAISEVCDTYSVREVRSAWNRGSYHARNRGLEEARGQHVAFVDADITLTATWLETGRRALQDADYVGGPVVIPDDQVTTPSAHYERLKGFKTYEEDDHQNFFVTANLFVAREVFETIGGFDERLRSGGDNEFGTRVFRAGQYVQRFDSNLVVFHPPRGYRRLVRKRVRIARGKKALTRLYPERYKYSRPSILKLCRRIVFPPRVSSVRRLYQDNPHFTFLDFYLFCWRFWVEVTLRLLPVYFP